VVLLTGHGSVEMAVEAMRKGAATFLTKPFSSESVAQVLNEARLARPAAAQVTRPLGAASAPRERAGASATGGPAIVGDDESFTSVLSLVDRVADTDVGILITGESG